MAPASTHRPARLLCSLKRRSGCGCSTSASWTTFSSSPRPAGNLRGAVKVVNQMLETLKLEKHPDKTFIGRIEGGFDFLGCHFSPAGLTVAAKTIANFIEKASQLYEQKRGAVLAATALEMYVRRRVRWARSECLNPQIITRCELIVSALT
jgi:hypothetical protein